MKYLILPLLMLASCAEPEKPITVAKVRYTFTPHARATMPGSQWDIYITDMHDADTGADYMIVQSGQGIVVVQVPAKPLEKP